MYNIAYYCGKLCLTAVVLPLTILVGATEFVSAQSHTGNGYKLTLAEAVEFAKTQNKWIKAADAEEDAVCISNGGTGIKLKRDQA